MEQNSFHIMKKIFLAFVLLLGGVSTDLFAQQDPLVSQYMFNGLLINPAYAGSRGFISTTLLHRSQWVGIEGAPRTQVFSVHGPTRGKINNFGLSVAHDFVGITGQTDVYGNYAYAIHLDKGNTLAFGLKGGFSYYNADFTKLVYWDEGDQLYSAGRQSTLLPNAGAGAYFYNERFYAGISVPSLISYDPDELFAIRVDQIPHRRRVYFLTSGLALPVSEDLVLKPSFLLRYTPEAPLQADLNFNVLFYNKLWLGASYRTGDAVLGLLELQVNRKFRVGYAYDYTLSDLNRWSSGSHEIMISYEFGYDIIKMKTPRYF